MSVEKKFPELDDAHAELARQSIKRKDEEQHRTEFVKKALKGHKRDTVPLLSETVESTPPATREARSLRARSARTARRARAGCP